MATDKQSLRNQIAAHIEKHVEANRFICEDHRGSVYVEYRDGLFQNLADAIIPMVKASLKKKKPKYKEYYED